MGIMTEIEAIELLEKQRWPNGVICPYCTSKKTCKHVAKGRENRHQCWECQKSFSVTVGTVFHRSHVSLNKWFELIELLNAEPNISSYQAAIKLDMRRPTVWAMRKKLIKQGLVEG